MTTVADPWPDDEWEALHFSGVEEMSDDDLTGELIPAHLVPGRYNCVAIRYRGTKWRSDLPAPTYTCTDLTDTWRESVWYLQNPVEPGQVKSLNLYKMISAALVYQLGGTELTDLLSPFIRTEEGRWSWTEKRTSYTLWELRDHLKAVSKFNHHLHPDFLSKGGSMRTVEQTEARRMNLAKGREAARLAHRRRQLARAEQILRLVDRGLNNDELARELGVQPVSVSNTVRRARLTLGMPEPVEPAPAPVRKLTLEEMRAALMADLPDPAPRAPVEPPTASAGRPRWPPGDLWPVTEPPVIWRSRKQL